MLCHHRPTLLPCALLLGTLALNPLAASANDNYPNRAVRLLVGYAPGGPVDTTARVFARYLGDQLGQPVIVENRAGASGMIASDAVAKADADGYTLSFAASPTLTISPQVQASSRFDPRTDFTPIGLVVDYTNVLLIGPQIAAGTVQELIDHARANPDAVAFGSAGVGASNHLSAELLRQQSEAPMLHVPYRGNAPAMVDVVSGKVTFMFDITSTALPFIRSGQARALAVTSRERNPELPDVPTMIEAGLPDYEVVGWYALLAPADLPEGLRDRLAAANQAVAQNSDFRQTMVAGGYRVNPGDGAALQTRIDDEYALWGQVIAGADMQAQ